MLRRMGAVEFAAGQPVASHSKHLGSMERITGKVGTSRVQTKQTRATSWSVAFTKCHAPWDVWLAGTRAMATRVEPCATGGIQKSGEGSKAGEQANRYSRVRQATRPSEEQGPRGRCGQFGSSTVAGVALCLTRALSPACLLHSPCLCFRLRRHSSHAQIDSFSQSHQPQLPPSPCFICA